MTAGSGTGWPASLPAPQTPWLRAAARAETPVPAAPGQIPAQDIPPTGTAPAVDDAPVAAEAAPAEVTAALPEVTAALPEVTAALPEVTAVPVGTDAAEAAAQAALAALPPLGGQRSRGRVPRRHRPARHTRSRLVAWPRIRKGRTAAGPDPLAWVTAATAMTSWRPVPYAPDPAVPGAYGGFPQAGAGLLAPRMEDPFPPSSGSSPGSAAGGSGAAGGGDMMGSGARPGSGKIRSWNGYERRHDDHLRRLSREFDPLCTGAVDAAEITAGLESAGFTDSAAREYGYPDVFSLADALFRLTPRVVNPRPGRLANPWAERPLKHLTRGVTFALPGLVFVACLPAIGTTADLIALVVALVFGWPAGQTLAFLGYTLDGRWHPKAARAVLGLGLVISMLLAAAYLVAGMRWGVAGPYAVLGAGEIVYLAAASVLLVAGYERTLLALLVPGLAGAGLAWYGITMPWRQVTVPWTQLTLTWHGTGRTLLLVTGAAVTLLITVVLALAVSARARPRDLRTALASLSRDDRREARLHTLYGAAGGVLVSLPLLALGARGTSSLSLLPVIWSMGWAEWSIVKLRRRSFELLNEAITINFFRLFVRRLARRSVLRYLTVLTVLSVLLLGAVRVLTGAGPDEATLVGLAGSWLLGWGFYLALVLSSLGQMRIVVPCMLAAVAAGASILVVTGQPLAIVVAPLVLCLLLLVPVQGTIGDPTRHM